MLDICKIWCCIHTTAEVHNGALRLAAGGQSVSNGFLEMYNNSQWGRICSDGWDIVDTRVACSQLGFPECNSVLFNVSATGTQPIHSSNVQCTGTESSIFACSQDPIGTNTCDRSSVVVVMCDAAAAGSGVGKGTIIDYSHDCATSIIHLHALECHCMACDVFEGLEKKAHQKRVQWAQM